VLGLCRKTQVKKKLRTTLLVPLMIKQFKLTLNIYTMTKNLRPRSKLKPHCDIIIIMQFKN